MELSIGDIIIYDNDYMLILEIFNINNKPIFIYNISQNSVILYNDFDLKKIYKCNSILTLTKNEGILKWSKDIDYNNIENLDSIIKAPTQNDINNIIEPLPECAEVGNCKTYELAPCLRCRTNEYTQLIKIDVSDSLLNINSNKALYKIECEQCNSSTLEYIKDTFAINNWNIMNKTDLIDETVYNMTNKNSINTKNKT
jgi:hypothetical protein